MDSESEITGANERGTPKRAGRFSLKKMSLEKEYFPLRSRTCQPTRWSGRARDERVGLCDGYEPDPVYVSTLPKVNVGHV